jgi:hypothetical protein
VNSPFGNIEVRGARGHLGLWSRQPEGPPDACIRIPENKEAVFRSAVRHNGIPVSDTLQVWLDVSSHPTRGKEQAGEFGNEYLLTLHVNGHAENEEFAL